MNETYGKALRRARREPLWAETGPAPDVPVASLLRQREPFLMLQSLDAYNESLRAVSCTRSIHLHDPIFVGHFPDEPVYPAVLLLETMGQLALCLVQLLGIPERSETPPRARFTRVLEATFDAAVKPGDVLRCSAQLLDADVLRATALAQIRRGETVCAAAVLEVCFV